jgi:hypothetical protein
MKHYPKMKNEKIMPCPTIKSPIFSYGSGFFPRIYIIIIHLLLKNAISTFLDWTSNQKKLTSK